MTTKLIIFLILLVAAVFTIMKLTGHKSQQVYSDGFVRLAGIDVQVDLADTEAKRELGLGFRDSLTDNQGMLFVFDQPNSNSFWMKNMNFAIDIIWIKNGKVVDISRSVAPQPGVSDGDLNRYSPSEYVDRVLEVKSGWAERYGLKVGDSVDFTAAQ